MKDYEDQKNLPKGNEGARAAYSVVICRHCRTTYYTVVMNGVVVLDFRDFV